MYASGEFMLVADNYNPTPGSGENGYVWRSTDFGATWNKITSLGQANWQGVGFGNNYALATASNHVYRSTDYGATWTQVL
jgi:photosystem II stability/assembly factor-like uncharacterized protein